MNHHSRNVNLKFQSKRSGYFLCTKWLCILQLYTLLSELKYGYHNETCFHLYLLNGKLFSCNIWCGLWEKKRKGKLDNSRKSMPVLARQSTSGVETSKHAGHTFAFFFFFCGCTTPKEKASGCYVCLGKAGPSYINMGPWPPHPCPVGPNYMFEHLWSQLVALVAKKKQALYILIWAPGAIILQHMLHVYYCGCVEDQYLSPYQTRAECLPWLLRKKQALYI